MPTERISYSDNFGRKPKSPTGERRTARVAARITPSSLKHIKASGLSVADWIELKVKEEKP